MVIDFSSAAAIEAILRDCRQTGTPLVIGSTGHTDSQRTLIAEAAREVPIVFAANFSVGVNALFWLTRRRGVTDPVCGMKVDRAKAFTTQHDGHTFSFCSEHCRHAFASART